LPVEQGLLGTQPPPVCDCRRRATVHAGTGHGQLMLHTQRRCDPCPLMRNTAGCAAVRQRCGWDCARGVASCAIFRTGASYSQVAPSGQELSRDCRRVTNQSSNPAQSTAPHRPEAADSQSPGTGALRHSAQVGLTSYRSFDHRPSARLEIFLDPRRPLDMMVVSTRVRTNYFKEPARVNKWRVEEGQKGIPDG
jgi:hypothetical protein